MVVVAITGVSGFLGSQLLARLDTEKSVDRIIGFDIKPACTTSEKLKFFHMDVRDPSLGSVLKKENVDIVVHLAFVLYTIRDNKKWKDIDVNGSRNVVSAIKNSSARKVILASSTSVYGVHRDNPNPIFESQPLNPNPDNLYAVHKKEVEDIFLKFSSEHQEITVTIFRPCMTLGPHMDNLVCQLALKLPKIITVKNHNPLLQFAHEDDVAEAFIFAIKNDVPGIFNLVSKGTITMERFCEIYNKDHIQLSFGLLYKLHSILWALRFPYVTFPPGWLHFLRYSCIASGEKFENEYSFLPSFSTEDALKSYIEARVKK